MANFTPAFLGSTLEVKVGLEMSNGAFHLADETTTFTVEFYNQGKHNAKTIQLEKSNLYFDESDSDSFVAHLPTDELEAGTVCCTIAGQYLDTEHSGDTEETQIFLPFVHSLTIPVILNKKYL